MTRLATLITILALSGCANGPAGLQRFYMLDLDSTSLCRNYSHECYDLELIIPSYNDDRIGRAYQLEPVPMIMSTEQLTQLLLQTDKRWYSATLEEDGRYRLPANYQTDTVFRYLSHEYWDMYGDDEDDRHLWHW